MRLVSQVNYLYWGILVCLIFRLITHVFIFYSYIVEDQEFYEVVGGLCGYDKAMRDDQCTTCLWVYVCYIGYYVIGELMPMGIIITFVKNRRSRADNDKLLEYFLSDTMSDHYTKLTKKEFSNSNPKKDGIYSHNGS